MHIKPFSLICIAILLPVICQAQDVNNAILMTVDGRKIESGEFIRMYNKSTEPGKKLDVNEYMKQFTIFKLKIADAIHHGYDTTKAFRTELNGYRNQLSQNYLTDIQLREKLLRTAYKRTLTEIKAWHILITLPPDAFPADTLKAWEKASDVRKRIIMGESFEHVARGVSDDQSVKVNGGNLGFFTAFQMIMPFEDAAWSLKFGEISQPIRTPYGYHIIKVTDRRPSKGKIKVAHIMKAITPGMEGLQSAKAGEEINIIYEKLQDGGSFTELAKIHSDHKESAAKGGELEWFGTGETISDFSEAAFAIKDTGKYSKPIRTLYGWHIIKLLDRKAPGSFEESRSYLESRINQSYLNSINKKLFIEKLKKEYKFRLNPEACNWFIQNTDTLIIQGLKKYDRTSMPSGNVYSFSDQSYTTKDFADFVEKRGFMIVTKDSAQFITNSIETRATDHLMKYENSVLEKKNPEFRYLMNEFHDGILLFEISGKKIWNMVSNDSLGLRKYYEEHKNNYLTKPGIEARIYTLKVPDGDKILASAYKKYSRKSGMDDLLARKFNKKNDTLLIIKDGKWYKGDDPEIDKLPWNKGTSSFKKDGFPSIINIKTLLESVPLSFEIIQGEMMTGYQEYLESSWIEQLKEKYNVKIDNLIFERIKKKLSNE